MYKTKKRFTTCLNLNLNLSLLSCNLSFTKATVTLGECDKSGMRVQISSEPLRGSVVSMVNTLRLV